MAYTPPLAPVENTINSPEQYGLNSHFTRTTEIEGGNFIHTDSVYNALLTSSSCSTTCSSGTSRSPR